MKLTFLLQGSRGDLQPYLGLALGLKATGQEVTLAGNENFSALAAACGLRFHPLPLDSRSLVEDPEARRRLMADDTYGFFKRVFELAAPQQRAICVAADKACAGAEVIVGTAVIDHLAVSLAEKHSAKLVLSYLAPVTPSPRYAPPVLFPSAPDLGPLNSLLHSAAQWAWWRINRSDSILARQDLGLAPSHGNPLSVARRRQIPTLFGYSPCLFEAGLRDVNDLNRVCGAWDLPPELAHRLPGDHHDEGFQRWLDDGPPPVFFGFGSMPVLQPLAFIELVGEVCESLGLRGVIGAGWSDLDLADCDLPDDLAIVGACDYAWLFSHCAAVVHHGGAGTTHTATRAGVPQVVCPVFADQPFWAGRIEALGLGQSLPFKRLNAESLRQALLAAMTEACQERATAMAQKLQAEDAVQSFLQALS